MFSGSEISGMVRTSEKVTIDHHLHILAKGVERKEWRQTLRNTLNCFMWCGAVPWEERDSFNDRQGPPKGPPTQITMLKTSLYFLSRHTCHAQYPWPLPLLLEIQFALTHNLLNWTEHCMYETHPFVLHCIFHSVSNCKLYCISAVYRPTEIIG